MIKHPLLMKDDPLGFIYKFHQLISYRKSSSFFVFIGLSVVIVVTLIGSYNLWKENGTQFLEHHLTNYFLSPWVWATMVTENLLIRSTLKLIHRNKFWDIGTTSCSMRSRLQEIIKMKRIEVSLYLLQCLLVGLVCPLIGQTFGHTVYIDIHYTVNYYSGSKLSKVTICASLYLAHQIVTFYAMSSFMMLKYITQSVIIQLYILADFLNYADEYKNDHQLIRNHLKICASHHIFILGLIKILQKVCYTPIIYLLVCGQLVLLGCSIFLYYNHQLLDLLQIGPVMFISYVLAMDFCQSGQDCNDALDEFRLNLLRLKWYNWDESNKRTLLIILSRTQKDEKIKTLGLSVDRTLMVTILKFAYQAVLLFLNMNSRVHQEVLQEAN